MSVQNWEGEMWLARPREEIFEFFSDARNLAVITPPSLGFQILTPDPIRMERGRLIDYRVRVLGVPLRWQSRISVWNPPLSFVDTQTRGPYRSWVHEHRFEEHAGGTTVYDQVRYSVPGGHLVNLLFVRRELRKIFGFREKKLAEIFA